MYDEAKIIEGCKKYNGQAQKLLFEKYAPMLRGICLRYVNNPQEAKDIVQEGFLKVFSNISQFKGQGSFEGWLKRIFINTAITHFNKNKKHYYHSDITEIKETTINGGDEGTESSSDKEIDLKDVDEESIDLNMIKNAEFSQEELLEALKVVPEMFRIVFNLYAIENYQHKEIAEALKIDENTSRTRLLRAKKYIQRELYKMSIKKLAK